MARILLLLQAALLGAAEAAPAAPAAAPASGDPWRDLLAAVGLLVLGVVLAVAEFFIPSGGAIAIAAVICGVVSIVFAFSASALAGWVFVLLVPLLGVLILRAGLRWMMRSPLVPQAEITEDAGYRHAAERLGVAVGAVGALVTMARPGGKARFTGPAGVGELDVVVRGPGLEAGAAVRVIAIEGPTITVVAAEPPPATPSSPT